MRRLSAALIRRPWTLVVACGFLVALSAPPVHAQCVQPPAGLIAWWPLDGTPNDIVGPNNPSSVNGVSYQQGQVLQGATFSQAMPTPSTGMRIPQGTLTPAKFTIGAWVQIFGPGPDRNDDYHGAYIIIKPLSAYWPAIALNWCACNYRFRVEFGDWNLNKYGFIDSAAAGAVGPTSYGPDGKFHHVTATYDGTYYKLYVDGDLKGSGQDTTPVNYNAGTPWVIGANYYTNSAYRTFNGVIDEVQIFDRALSQGEIRAIYAAGTAGMCKSLAKGMTWRWGGANATTGTVIVGCGASDPVHPCNGYVGDQLCADSLPLLCFKPTPILPKPTSVVETPYYYLWSDGIVGTTAPVAPAAAPISSSLTNANKRCADEFGAGWRVAEFHDGAQGKGGWDFLAYGNVGDPKTRFWVHINDQPKDTCFTKK